MTTLYAGQKFRFTGRDGIARAKELAAELQPHCKRNGPEIELTCEHEISFKARPERRVISAFLRNGNGAKPTIEHNTGEGSAAGESTRELAGASAKPEPSPRIAGPFALNAGASLIEPPFAVVRP